MNKYSKLNIIKNCKSVCLLTHKEPDADALSSTIVLREFLKKHFNIPVVDVYAECSSLPENYIPILGNIKINKTIRNYSTAILIDCPNTSRLGIYEHLFKKAKNKIVIDHHSTNLFQGDVNIVENVSSTCEIIYSILKYYKFEISKQNQGKLFAGIITDTNNFTVGNITKTTFKIASEFEDFINREEIYSNFLANTSFKSLQLLSLAIQNSATFDHNQIIISHISHEEAHKYKVTSEDLNGIINKLAATNTAKLICFIKPTKNLYYVSMRSRKGAKVSEIAKKHGGGGHDGAAAFESNLSLKDIEQLILTEFRNELAKTPIVITKIF